MPLATSVHISGLKKGIIATLKTNKTSISMSANIVQLNARKGQERGSNWLSACKMTTLR